MFPYPVAPEERRILECRARSPNFMSPSHSASTRSTVHIGSCRSYPATPLPRRGKFETKCPPPRVTLRFTRGYNPWPRWGPRSSFAKRYLLQAISIAGDIHCRAISVASDICCKRYPLPGAIHCQAMSIAKKLKVGIGEPPWFQG